MPEYANLGGAASPKSSMPDKGRINSITERIVGLTDMVSHIQANARSVGDSLFGPRPEPATDGSLGKHASYGGSLDEANAALDRLAMQIDELGSLVRRFGDL